MYINCQKSLYFNTKQYDEILGNTLYTRIAPVKCSKYPVNIETISGLTDGNEDQNHNRTLKWISCPQFGKQREIAVPGEQRIDPVCNAESGYSGIVNNAADHMRA